MVEVAANEVEDDAAVVVVGTALVVTEDEIEVTVEKVDGTDVVVTAALVVMDEAEDVLEAEDVVEAEDDAELTSFAPQDPPLVAAEFRTFFM